MAISEQSRHELHTKLEETVGQRAATTLMEHLPPVGWADVATKQDLAQMEERLALRFEAIDLRFEAVDQRFDHVDQRTATKEDLERALRQQTWRLAGLMVTTMGAALGAFAALG